MTSRMRLRVYQVGFLVGLAIVMLAMVGEVLHWWRDSGVVLGLLGIVIAFWFGVGAASERTVLALGEPLATLADHMKTTHAILVRIEALLEARLPRP